MWTVYDSQHLSKLNNQSIFEYVCIKFFSMYNIVEMFKQEIIKTNKCTEIQTLKKVVPLQTL